MNGSDFYTFVQSLVPGLTIDQVAFYRLLNTARTKRELLRAWMYLRKYQYTQTVSVQNAPTTIPTGAALTIPSDFMFMTRDGEITLYDDNNQYETYLEIPLNLAIPYLQVNNYYYADYAASKFYLLGNVQKAYKAFIQYQAELGDIASGTSWLNIPSRFHPILGYDVAAMYRLGVDYDDINARNADQNAKDAELLYGAMVSWDDNLQRSSTTRMNLPAITDVPGANFNHKIDISNG